MSCTSEDSRTLHLPWQLLPGQSAATEELLYFTLTLAATPRSICSHSESVLLHYLGSYSQVNLQPLRGALVLGTPAQAVRLVDPGIALMAALVPLLGVGGAGCDLPVLDVPRDHTQGTTRVTCCRGKMRLHY